MQRGDNIDNSLLLSWIHMLQNGEAKKWLEKNIKYLITT